MTGKRKGKKGSISAPVSCTQPASEPAFRATQAADASDAGFTAADDSEAESIDSVDHHAAKKDAILDAATDLFTNTFYGNLTSKNAVLLSNLETVREFRDLLLEDKRAREEGKAARGKAVTFTAGEDEAGGKRHARKHAEQRLLTAAEARLKELEKANHVKEQLRTTAEARIKELQTENHALHDKIGFSRKYAGELKEQISELEGQLRELHCANQEMKQRLGHTQCNNPALVDDEDAGVVGTSLERFCVDGLINDREMQAEFRHLLRFDERTESRYWGITLKEHTGCWKLMTTKQQSCCLAHLTDLEKLGQRFTSRLSLGDKLYVWCFADPHKQMSVTWSARTKEARDVMLAFVRKMKPGDEVNITTKAASGRFALSMDSDVKVVIDYWLADVTRADATSSEGPHQPGWVSGD